jgi:hypothetical protein
MDNILTSIRYCYVQTFYLNIQGSMLWFLFFCIYKLFNMAVLENTYLGNIKEKEREKKKHLK